MDVLIAEDKSYKLSEFLWLVKGNLASAFPHAVWVEGEINGITGAGEEDAHCYLDLLELDALGNKIASVRGHIWRSKNIYLAEKFESVTGRIFTNGDKVRFQVKVDFSEKFGFTLNIIDIDPNFTLGDLAAKKMKTWQRLVNENLTELNKELSIPNLPFRVAVVSAAGAAGYGDFINQLHIDEQELDCRFSIQLFEAWMQGDLAPQSIYDAFAQIAQSAQKFDVVVFIRGGGSDIDLACFDDYLVCRAIAECDYPVISGIGHERDNHLCDEVSAVRVKTPTAAATFLSGVIALQKEKVADIEKSILQNLQQKIHSAELVLQRNIAALSGNFSKKLQHDNILLREVASKIERNINTKIYTQQLVLQKYITLLNSSFNSKYNFEDHLLQEYAMEIERNFTRKLNKAGHTLEIMEQKILSYNPVKVLERGYALLDADGKKVTKISQIKEGSRLRVQMRDGVAEFVVTELRVKEKQN